MNDLSTCGKVAWEEADRILKWLEERDFAGHDPFDGLESRVFARLPLLPLLPLARLAWIQVFKRSPINLRRLAQIPPSRNPKGMGLVLSGLARLGEARGRVERQIGERVIDLLRNARPRDSSGWGYPFPWQNRAFYAPRNLPNAVCTCFVVDGLLDFADVSGVRSAAELGESAACFFRDELQRTEAEDGGACFSYTPLDRTRIHNVNLLVCAALARIGTRLRDETLMDLARAGLLYAVRCQRADGSWPYGEDPGQQWVDSFHTGFNLCSLRRLTHDLRDERAATSRRLGFKYFKHRLADDQGCPMYFAGRRYPIDAHACAQAVLTWLDATDLDRNAVKKACTVAQWTTVHLQRRPGEYMFQRGRRVAKQVVYARWSQAWMFRALSELQLAVAETPARLGETTNGGGADAGQSVRR